MRVSDLAKELSVAPDTILAKLKNLKLKSKDSKQELSEAAIAVLRRELAGAPKIASKAKEEKTIVRETKSPPEKKSAKVVKSKSEAKASSKTKSSVKEKTKEPVKAKGAEKRTTEKKPQPTKVVEEKHASEKAAPSKPIETAKIVSPAPVQVKPVVAPIKREVSTSTPSSQPPRPAVVPQRFDSRIPGKHQPQKPVVEVKPEPIKSIGNVELNFPISVKDLSVRLQLKPSVVLKKLMEKGTLATINQILSEETVTQLSVALGFTFTKSKTQEEQLIEDHTQDKEDPKLLKPRSPVVTFMGHVDHGKTSLVDRIRKTKVVDSEHGGITQHIGAYSVNMPKGRITFLDTPGHEAFTAMRARGAHITDIVVLVIASDEGIMPQTEEAIDHARAANVPIIIALSKIDKRGADLDRVKKQLQSHDLAPEDWGGKTICVGVSAFTGEGIDTLLEMILLESELLELKANYEKKATGIVVEAQLSQGKGPIATVIVQNGTLREGEMVIVGPYYGRIKAMFDDRERPIKEAGPAMPAEILGISGVPEAGEIFYVIEDEKRARDIIQAREESIKNLRFQPTPKVTLEDLYSQIKEGKIRELNIIIKADVQGSLEALKDSLSKINNEEVSLKFIHTGVGEVNMSDALLAEASNAIIIAFNVDANSRAKAEIEKRQVEIRNYRIIYDAIKEVKNALEGLLEPKTKKKFVGRVEIRQVFKLSKSGTIAGCFVVKGKVHRKVNLDVVRNGGVVFTGTLSSLKRFKDDVREVTEGFECGISINGYNEYQPGDVIECFELEKIARTL